MFILAISAAALPRADHLEISSGGHVLLRLPAGAGEALGLDYTHSIYGAPVHEEYRLLAGRGLVLDRATSSAAALEYSGLWPDAYLADGTGTVRLDRTIGSLDLSVDNVGRQSLSAAGARLDLRALLDGEGQARVSMGSGSRLGLWLRSMAQARALIIEDADAGDRLWSAVVLPGESFSLSYLVPTYGERITETFAVAGGGQLILRQASYGSGALAADCSIQCDRNTRADGDFGTERSTGSLILRLPDSSGLTVELRGAGSGVATGSDRPLRLYSADGPRAWARWLGW